MKIIQFRRTISGISTPNPTYSNYPVSLTATATDGEEVDF
jgi:hypothetical protein